MKYRVTLEGANIWDEDRKVDITAVSAANAKEIANMRYKKLNAIQAVRIGVAPSTVKTMTTIKDDFVAAMNDCNKELAERHEKAFYATLANLQKEMDVVAFGMAKKHLPELPPLGK